MYSRRRDIRSFSSLWALSQLPRILIFIVFHIISFNVSALAAENTPETEQKQALEKLLKEAEAEQKSQQLDEKQEILDEAVNDFIVRDEQGKEVVCSKENTIATEVDGEVRYRCRSQSQALGEEKDSKRGEGETNQLIEDLMQTSNQSDEKQLSLDKDELKNLQQVKTMQQDSLDAAAEQGEKTPNNAIKTDILSPDNKKKEQDVIIPIIPDKGLDGVDVLIETGDPSAPKTDNVAKYSADVAVEISDIKEQGFVDQPPHFLSSLPIKAYLSMRTNIDSTAGEEIAVSDGGSRGGLIYAQRLKNDDQVIVHVELGTDIFGSINASLNDETNTAGQDINRRLSYVRFGRDDYYFVVGKNWSVYHFVASMTDKFITVGGKATGIYNANSDGGATGSGRADNALQLRSSRGNIQWGLQIQTDNSIPHLQSRVDYLLNAGLAGKWKSLQGYSIGFAYNRAVPETYTQEMLDLGLLSSSDVMVLGAEVDLGDWHLASTLSHSQNQVTDDTGHYYDANGWELYTRYDFAARYHGRYGFNWQEPDDDIYQGQHEIKELYLSFDYNYNRLNMQDRVYLEYVHNNGHNADGSEAKNIVVLGFYFNLSN